MAPPARRKTGRRRVSLTRLLAVALAAAFALIGAIPLALGLLVRTDLVRSWAASETSRLLASELGVTARFDAVVEAWPLLVRLDDVVIDGTDPARPFLTVEKISVRPRLFSLLAGKLDAGDIEVLAPRIHAVIAGGKLANFTTKPLPPSTSSTGPSAAPFASLSVTDAHIDATVDGAAAIDLHEVDVDVTAEDGGAYELALRAGKSAITRVRARLGEDRAEDSVDEDVLCRLDVRARLEPGAVLVRRLRLGGSVDADPDPGTRPACNLPSSDWRGLGLRVGGLRVELEDGAPTAVTSGRVGARVPLLLANRFVPMPPVTGSLQLDVDGSYDGATKLPRLSGRIGADSIGLDSKLFAERLSSKVALRDDAVIATGLDVTWGDGKVTIESARLDPFKPGMPLDARSVDIKGIAFDALLRDLGAHPEAHVRWDFESGRLDRFGGTLSPLSLSGPIAVKTRNFEVFDRPARAPMRRHMIGVEAADVRGTFMVRPDAIVLSGFTLDTRRSHVSTTVTLGFASVLDFVVGAGTRIDLADISPLVELPIGGVVDLTARAHGEFNHPKILAEASIQKFDFAGFPVGDVKTKASFEPLALDLTEVTIQHGASRIRSPKTRIDFDAGPDVQLDGLIDTTAAPHLTVADFFEVFHFDKDPRFKGIAGVASGTAEVHYVMGGKQDRCGGGVLDIKTQMALEEVTLFDEHYSDGFADVQFLWDDALAGSSGMRIDLRSATLRKGEGVIVASGAIRHGGLLDLSIVGSAIPIDRLDMFGPAARFFDGAGSFVASVGGSFDAMNARADIDVGRVRIGPSSLGPSRLTFTMEPSPPASAPARKTRCGNPISLPFSQAEYDRDRSQGLYRVDGALFDDQVLLDGVTMTQQRSKTAKGKVHIEGLDLGTVSNLIPGMAFAEEAPVGRLSGDVDITKLSLDHLESADVTMTLRELRLARRGASVELSGPSAPIRVVANSLHVPDLTLRARTSSGLTATLTAGGQVSRVMSSPDLDISLAVEPIDLSSLSGDLPQVSHASGKVSGKLRVVGSPTSPRLSGFASLAKGELGLKGSPITLSDVNVDVDVDEGEIRMTRGVASVGGGTVSLKARAPLRGLSLGIATAELTARDVRLPVADGVELTADADLEAILKPADSTGDLASANLPEVTGTVALTSFNYTRPIGMSLDLSQLTGRSQRTEVSTYSPKDDLLRFRVNVVSPKPLRFSNNLLDMQLEVVAPGLVLSGTNQRFGAQGALRILPDSKIDLRSNIFEVREGLIRFDDAERIRPRVDLHAESEFRRYGEAAAAEAGPATTGGSANAGGLWKISLRASGEPDKLKLDLTSDPGLSQEDIILLLTLGMTRAEMDSGLASSLGQTVGLEALSQLTGADKAVKTIVPIIDEFRFGTGYSSRTGRTEPTITLGKRITDSVRASVTTGLTESREVRSTVEWKISKRVSVQGSYDNVNDASSSLFGNLGADLRWRIEFE